MAVFKPRFHHPFIGLLVFYEHWPILRNFPYKALVQNIGKIDKFDVNLAVKDEKNE